MLIKALGNNVNWEFYNYLQYFKTKQAIEEGNTTLIPEEFANRQANRPTHYNIVIVGDSVTTVDFTTITGTLTGWYFDGTDWYLDTAISTGLSGTTLTFQTGTQYVAFADDSYVYISNNNNSLIRIDKTDYSYVAEISTSTSGILSTNNDSPLLPFSLDIIGVIDCDEGLFPTDYSGTTTNATTYTSRKDQPLQVGGAAVNLDTTRNKEIQCSQSLTGVTVTAVYGEVGTTGEQIQIADIGIDTVNDKLYNDNAAGYDIKLARVDLSDGTVLKFLGNASNDAFIMLDASGNNNHAYIIYDVLDFNTTQKYYNDSVINGTNYTGYTSDVRNTSANSWTAIGSKGTIYSSASNTLEISGNNTSWFSDFRNLGGDISILNKNVYAQAGKSYQYKIELDVQKIGSLNTHFTIDVGDNKMSCTTSGITVSSIDGNRVLVDDNYLSTQTLVFETQVTKPSITNNYIDVALFAENDTIDNTTSNNRIKIHDFRVYVKIGEYDFDTYIPCTNNVDIYGNTVQFPSSIHLNNTQKQYVQLPTFKTLEYAYQSNEEYWRDKVDSQGNAVLDRHLVPLSLEHSDKGFPAFVYKTGDEWDLGTYINSRTITEVLGSNNVPSDFTIASNKITAAADVSFAALVLDNGDKLVYTGNNSYLLQNTSGANHGTLTTANVTLNQGAQDEYDLFEDGKFILRNNIWISDSLFNKGESPYSEVHGFTITPNQTDVDGGTNAILLTENNTNSNPRSTWFESDTLAFSLDVIAGETYTWSVWLKTSATFDGQQISIGVNGGQSFANGGTLVTLTTEWQRFSVTKTVTVTDTRNALIGGWSQITQGSGIEIYACKPQFEKGELTDYQPSLHDLGDLPAIDTYEIVPKHPYNGTDIFGNTLTTPRSKGVTKALKYTT